LYENIPLLIDNFKLNSYTPLGEGSFGKVFLARGLGGRNVAEVQDDEVCMVCKSGNDEEVLIICEGTGCKNGIHQYCLRPSMTELPVDDFYCGKLYSNLLYCVLL